MRKTIIFILTAVLLMIAFTGCVHQDIGVKINKDGTGSVTATIGIKKSFYDQLKEAGSEDPFDGKETFTEEYDGEEYISVKETQLFDSIEDVEKALADMTYSGQSDMLSGLEEPQDVIEATELSPETELNEDITAAGDDEIETDDHIFKSVEISKVKGTYSFKAVLNKITGEEALGYDMNDIYKISVSVEMPGKLKAYSDGGEADGGKVVFNIKDLGKENEIYAESTTGSSLPALIVTVLIVGGIATVFFMRKKKSN